MDDDLESLFDSTKFHIAAERPNSTLQQRQARSRTFRAGLSKASRAGAANRFKRKVSLSRTTLEKKDAED